MILPEDGVAQGVDDADGQAGLMVVMQMVGPFGEVGREQPPVDLLGSDFGGRLTIQRSLAVMAQPLLQLDILRPDSGSSPRGEPVVVGGQMVSHIVNFLS